MNRNAKYILPLILIVLIVFGILAWQKTESLSDFGLNFATEIIGVLITVYIVDFLLKYREEERLAPMKMIVYQEISVLNNRFLGLFFEFYYHSVKDPAPKTVKKFIRKNFIKKALLFTSINASPNVSPPQTMEAYLKSCASDFENRAEKILDKYALYIPPHISNIIHQLYIESTIIQVMKVCDKVVPIRRQNNFPDSLLFHLTDLSDSEKENLVELTKWLEKERLKLSKSNSEIRMLKTPEYISKRSKSHKLVYGIPEEELTRQINNYEESKKNSTNK